MKTVNDTKCLNSIKGIASIIVAFTYHYKLWNYCDGIFPAERFLFFSYNRGDLVVEMFFMLSGFGMMVGWADAIVNHKITFFRYMWKRIKKLYPLFL